MHLRHSLILSAWLASLAIPSLAGAAPNVPQTAVSIDGLVPSGWSVLAQAEGDLNRDGKADAVLVLKNDDEDREDRTDEIPRLLILAFREGNAYRVSGVSEKTIFCKMCGGALGDPFQEVKVDRGSVLIEQMGGSRERWTIRLRFRWQKSGAKEDWFLIGWTSEVFDRVNGAASSKDFNLLTGAVIEQAEEVTEADEHLPVKTTRAKRKPLVLRMVDYDPAKPPL